MNLTLENVQRIQQFLLDRGFIQAEPNGYWDFNKSSGYKTYLESRNVPYADIAEVPHKIEMLTLELQEYLAIPDAITIVPTEDETNLENTETNENSELTDVTLNTEENLDSEDASGGFVLVDVPEVKPENTGFSLFKPTKK